MKGTIVSLDSLDLTNPELEGGNTLLEVENQEVVNLNQEQNQDPPVEEDPKPNEEGNEGNEDNEEEEEEEEEEINPAAQKQEGSEEEEEDEAASVEDLITSLGYELPEGKAYEQSFEGITLAIKDLEPIIQQKAAEEFFEEYPLAADYARAKASGMSDIEWAKQVAAREVDYSLDELPEDNEAMHEAVVRNSLKAKGFKPEKIDVQIKRLKDADELYAEAKDFYEEDRVAQQAAAEAAKEQEKKDAIIRKKQEDDYLKDQKELIISKGKVGKITIPVKEREAFFKARHARTESGDTALAEKIRSMTPEQRAELDYFIWKGGNVEAVADKVAKTKKAELLLRKSNKSTGASGMGSGKQRDKVTGHVPNNVTDYIPSNTI